MFYKRVIFTLIISLLICVLIGFINSNIPSTELLKQLFVSKINSDKTYQLLIVGDSRVYRGVSPKPFEEILKVKAFNLGFSSVIFEQTIFNLIDQKLDTNSGKPILVLGITPHSLTKYTDPNGHIRQLQAMKKEEVISYLYLLRIKSVFNPISITSFLSKFSKTKYDEIDFIQTPYLDQGWVASDYRIRFPYGALKSYQTTFNNRKVDSTVMDQFFDQIKIWSEIGYDVYGFIPPSSPNIESLERSYSGFLDHTIAQRFIGSGGKWMDLDCIYHSYDGSHLIKEDALKLSNALAQKIKLNQVDTVFDFTKDYVNNYLPLESPKMSFYNGFNENEISYQTNYGREVGRIDDSLSFYSFTKINTDSLLQKRVKMIVTEADFLIPDQDNHFNLVYEIKRGQTNLFYEKLSSKWILKENVWGKMTFEIHLPDDLQSNDIIKCYLYNNENKEIFIDDLKVLFY